MPNLLSQRRILNYRFQPNWLDGLALWLDASDASTITLDGSNNVSQWNDKSNNANHATQSSSTLRPVGAGAINGRMAIDFDGADDFLEIANSASIDLGPTLSIFIVHKADTTSARQTLFNFINTVAGVATPDVEIGTSPTFYDNTYAVVRPTTYVFTAPASAATTSAAVIGFLVDGSANLVLRKNGTDIATTASAGISLVGSGTNKMVGARASGSQPFDGRIGEIVVYNKKLTESAVNSVESYLISKWGIA